MPAPGALDSGGAAHRKILDVVMITDEQKRASLQRALAFCQNCYPRWVSEGRMTQEYADTEILILQAILDDYRDPNLFSRRL